MMSVPIPIPHTLIDVFNGISVAATTIAPANIIFLTDKAIMRVSCSVNFVLHIIPSYFK